MKKLIYLLLILFLLSFYNVYSYDYYLSDQGLIFDLSGGIYSFSGFDSFEFCYSNFINDSNISINIREIDCNEVFLATISGYLSKEKEIFVVYSEESDYIYARRLAENYGLNVINYTKALFYKNYSFVFIGNSCIPIGGYNFLEDNKSKIKLESRNILIYGVSEQDTEELVNLLIKAKENYYYGKNCTIFTGCETYLSDLDFDGNISNFEVLNLLRIKNISIAKKIETIALWEIR